MANRMTLYKMVVLGDGGVGKTALTIQVRIRKTHCSTTLTVWKKLCLNHFVETYDPTIEDSYRKQVVIDGQSCMLEVLDTAGQEEYTALRDQWIRDGEGFILAYSITSRASFSRIQKFYQQIQRVKESSSGAPSYPGALQTGIENMGPAPVMLVGNKSDRVTDREVSTQEGAALAKQLRCEFVEASAKNSINVEKAFYDVVRQLRRQRNQATRATEKRPYGSNSSRNNKERDERVKPKKEKKRSRMCVIL